MLLSLHRQLLLPVVVLVLPPCLDDYVLKLLLKQSNLFLMRTRRLLQRLPAPLT